VRVQGYIICRPSVRLLFLLAPCSVFHNFIAQKRTGKSGHNKAHLSSLRRSFAVDCCLGLCAPNCCPCLAYAAYSVCLQPDSFMSRCIAWDIDVRCLASHSWLQVVGSRGVEIGLWAQWRGVVEDAAGGGLQPRKPGAAAARRSSGGRAAGGDSAAGSDAATAAAPPPVAAAAAAPAGTQTPPRQMMRMATRQQTRTAASPMATASARSWRQRR